MRFKLRGRVYRLSTGTTRCRDANRIAARLRAEIESQCTPPEPEPEAEAEAELVDVGVTPPAAAAEPPTESCTPGTTLADHCPLNGWAVCMALLVRAAILPSQCPSPEARALKLNASTGA
ncbi:MAG: hypothetical protein AAF211_26720 [Myxococcota bacterium]